MSTKVTIQDIANELQLSRNTVSKAINNTGVLADATREKILRKAAEMGYKQFSYLPVFDGNSNAGDASILPVDKREIAILTTRFLNNSHFAAMMLDRFQSELQHLHACMTIHRISPAELAAKELPSSLNTEHTAGIICFEVFDYDYAQMLCTLGIPLLFVDTPVMEMRPPLQADRLYMENVSPLPGIKNTASLFMNVTGLTRMQPSILVWQPTGRPAQRKKHSQTIRSICISRCAVARPYRTLLSAPMIL